ncbi:hypothetical protein MTR67_030671 [Solanum verrucosum]|uniref:Uncharacterized protein n=1 Tax=Solanum verrucosum TaxID=315347 RepID=A0AAF0RE84_SOLVR|nr:hypothetical protein MTR67_030671 [Solanum verrucosum]
MGISHSYELRIA